jgi:hypothetical protein
VIVVVVSPLLTWWPAVPLLPKKFASPPYVAVSVFAPAVVDVNEQLPVPPTRLTIVQLPPVPSVTLTEPDGVPLPGGAAATVTLTV